MVQCRCRDVGPGGDARLRSRSRTVRVLVMSGDRPGWAEERPGPGSGGVPAQGRCTRRRSARAGPDRCRRAHRPERGRCRATPHTPSHDVSTTPGVDLPGSVLPLGPETGRRRSTVQRGVCGGPSHRRRGATDSEQRRWPRPCTGWQGNRVGTAPPRRGRERTTAPWHSIRPGPRLPPAVARDLGAPATGPPPAAAPRALPPQPGWPPPALPPGGRHRRHRTPSVPRPDTSPSASAAAPAQGAGRDHACPVGGRSSA